MNRRLFWSELSKHKSLEKKIPFCLRVSFETNLSAIKEGKENSKSFSVKKT